MYRSPNFGPRPETWECPVFEIFSAPSINNLTLLYSPFTEEKVQFEAWNVDRVAERIEMPTNEKSPMNLLFSPKIVS
ncbi:hypothetical protein OVS_01720 [Mycoplasma ovis str. Michigan]|uniref:Uncharacterized protein n=1 Tax=Mycoplasma ovis str. Michigan TaxID=1415773 RepID=A0ABM5P1B4_9MOLU|nr:hypothetical protein [Mycoplasma ovis]AHC40229.1 hypothetical protein OVS_01720 [Mycoplasma ovis str. Michigan]